MPFKQGRRIREAGTQDAAHDFHSLPPSPVPSCGLRAARADFHQEADERIREATQATDGSAAPTPHKPVWKFDTIKTPSLPEIKSDSDFLKVRRQVFHWLSFMDSWVFVTTEYIAAPLSSENATIDNCKIQLSMTQKSRKVDFDMTFFLDVTKTFFLVVTFFFLLPSEIKEEALATASTFLPSTKQCTPDAHALPVPPSSGLAGYPIFVE